VASDASPASLVEADALAVPQPGCCPRAGGSAGERPGRAADAELEWKRRMAEAEVPGQTSALAMEAGVLHEMLMVALAVATAWQYPAFDNATLQVMGFVDTSDCEISSYTDRQLEAEMAGGLKLHKRIREVDGDWVRVVVYLGEHGHYSLIPGQSLRFKYGDEVYSSLEVVAPTDGTERDLRSTWSDAGGIFLTEKTPPVTERGGYLLMVRFRENSLPRVDGKLAKPDAVERG
jgi:hypothetical protein